MGRKASASVSDNDEKEKIIEQYGYNDDSFVELKCEFLDGLLGYDACFCIPSAQYDLAAIHFENYKQKLYNGNAVFANDKQRIRQGDVCLRFC